MLEYARKLGFGTSPQTSYGRKHLLQPISKFSSQGYAQPGACADLNSTLFTNLAGSWVTDRSRGNGKNRIKAAWSKNIKGPNPPCQVHQAPSSIQYPEVFRSQGTINTLLYSFLIISNLHYDQLNRKPRTSQPGLLRHHVPPRTLLRHQTWKDRSSRLVLRQRHVWSTSGREWDGLPFSFDDRRAQQSRHHHHWDWSFSTRPSGPGNPQ